MYIVHGAHGRRVWLHSHYIECRLRKQICIVKHVHFEIRKGRSQRSTLSINI